MLPNRAPWVAITCNSQHLMMIILMIIIYFIQEHSCLVTWQASAMGGEDSCMCLSYVFIQS